MAANRITITLAANIDLPVGVVVQCEGFSTASVYKTGILPLLGPSAARFGGAADFRIDPRTSLVRLEMTLQSPVPANDELVFFFVFQNRGCSGTCGGSPVHVSAQGAGDAANIQLSGQVPDILHARAYSRPPMAFIHPRPRPRLSLWLWLLVLPFALALALCVRLP